MQLLRTATRRGQLGRQEQPRSPGGAFRAEILRKAGQTAQGKGQEKARGEVQEEAEGMRSSCMDGLMFGTFKDQARGGGVWRALGEAHSEQGTAQIPLEVVLSHFFLP